MPRPTKLDAPGALHHVMGRGIDSRDSQDRTDIDDLVNRLVSSEELPGLGKYLKVL